MKYRIETQKPNIYRKKLRSDILGKDFKLWISMKTRKCIMKQGSFDKYLLNTKPEVIHSKFGLHLRDLIKQKQKNPDMKIDYIPGTAKQKRSRETKVWEYKNVPAMYTPAHVRATTDMSLMYEKPPSEMSRYELQELEQMMKREEEGVNVEELMHNKVILGDDGQPLSKLEVFKLSDEFKETRAEIEKI